MFEPTQDSINEWKERIRLDWYLRYQGIEWLTEQEKLLGKSDDQAIDRLMLKTLCMASSNDYLPTSDEREALNDLWELVIDAYAEHRAKQDINDEIEAGADRRANGGDFTAILKPFQSRSRL